MKVIGVTGSFGTGKTFVSTIFKSFGAKVIDADSIAHGVIAKGGPAYKKIVETFGKEILSSDRNIVRAKLAAKVFGDSPSLRRINAIVHPYVIKAIKEKIQKSGPRDVIIVDAPLLIEAGLSSIVDGLIVVKATMKNQIERCGKKFCINREDTLKRIESQISLEEKIKLADFVIDNSGARSKTKKQVRKVWRKIAWK